ncbi:MAG: YkvA family protein [Chloroflexota bacterium]
MMSEDRRPVRMPANQDGAIVAWLKDFVRQLRLTWRLFWDGRVPLWTKVVPPAVLAYVLSPVDILPDFPPMGLNQLDDVAVLLLGVRLFVELAPPEVVREHLEALGARIAEWRVVEEGDVGVVEGRYEITGPDIDDQEPSGHA